MCAFEVDVNVEETTYLYINKSTKKHEGKNTYLQHNLIIE